MVQLSHQYMTTGKSIALTIEIFVGKVMSLLLSIKQVARCIFKKKRVRGWSAVSLRMDLAAREKSVRQSLFDKGTSAQRSGKWGEPCGYLGTGCSRWRTCSAEGLGSIQRPA